MAAKKSTRGAVRKIGRRAVNHAALSERYTLSTLPDREVLRVLPGDTYFAVRGGAGSLGVLRKGRTVGWIDVGRLHHLSARAWMQHVGQATSKRTKNPQRPQSGAFDAVRRGSGYIVTNGRTEFPNVVSRAAALRHARLLNEVAWHNEATDTNSGGFTSRELWDRLTPQQRTRFRASTAAKTRNPTKKAPKRARAGRPLREGQRVYHCATRCR